MPLQWRVLLGLPLALNLVGGLLVALGLVGHGCSKEDFALRHLRLISQGLELYLERWGTFPRTEEGLEVLVATGILEAIPMDPWGRAFIYEGHGRTFRVCSLGSDGAPGGADDEADLCAFIDLRHSSASTSLHGPDVWPPPFEGLPEQALSRGPPTLPVFRELPRPAGEADQSAVTLRPRRGQL